ncbi:MAG TPA: sulfur carrier protein ThiS [Candidatus Latescibacteria bacterium]|nr:sulfur carrier protein ThiS [Candidatus Latescibacterota bacterium]
MRASTTSSSGSWTFRPQTAQSSSPKRSSRISDEGSTEACCLTFRSYGTAKHFCIWPSLDDVRVVVSHDRKEEIVDVRPGTTVQRVLERLGISREAVVVKRNDRIVPEETVLHDGDRLEIIRVVSGG